MKAHLINMHLLLPRSRLSVKVNVICQGQGRISLLHQKMAIWGALVFHKGHLSRSSTKVKVEYQCYIPQKMAISGALAFHKQILIKAGIVW